MLPLYSSLRREPVSSRWVKLVLVSGFLKVFNFGEVSFSTFIGSLCSKRKRTIPFSISIRSVRPCQRGLQLNLDTTSGAYVQTGNLVDLLQNFANVRHPSDLNISNGRIQGATLISFNRLLRKVRVTIDRGSRTPSDKAKVLKLTIKGGIKLASARSHRFDVNGVQMSVEVSSFPLSA